MDRSIFQVTTGFHGSPQSNESTRNCNSALTTFDGCYRNRPAIEFKDKSGGAFMRTSVSAAIVFALLCASSLFAQNARLGGHRDRSKRSADSGRLDHRDKHRYGRCDDDGHE